VIELEQYQLVLLRRAAVQPASDPDVDGDALQAAHIAFYERLRADGHVVTNGPVRDQPDVALRGIAIMTAGTVERALELAADDPLVRGGWLELVGMNWWTRPGTMVRPGDPVRVD
jgi:uncharacterized protein